MIVLDVPDGGSTQVSPAFVAQASQSHSHSDSDRTIGVCEAIENSPDPRGMHGSGLSPLLDVQNYLRVIEHKEGDITGTVSVVGVPTHGTLQGFDHGEYSYRPVAGYYGRDQVTFLMDMGGRKIKVITFLHVQDVVDDEDEKSLCPRDYWKIAVNSTGVSSPPSSRPLPAVASYTPQRISVTWDVAPPTSDPKEWTKKLDSVAAERMNLLKALLQE